MTLAKKKDDILYWALVGLILYMPLHYYLCELLVSGTSVDNILRDGVILLLTCMTWFYRKRLPKVMTLLVAVSCGVLLVLGGVSAVLNRSFPILNVLRTYFVPMLIYFVAAAVPMPAARFGRLQKWLFVQMALVAFYGFFQAFFLGDDFLVKLGYASREDGYLKSNSFYISHFFGYQRSTGTFISPNICGIILAMVICALLYTGKGSFRKRYVLAVPLVIGLVATFSRSAMLGLATGTCLYLLLNKSWRRITRRTFLRAGVVLATVGLFFLLDWLILDSLFWRMLLSTVLRTFDGTDPSANAHLDHLFTPPAQTGEPQNGETSWLAPFMQFGMNGPMAEEYLDFPNKVESSYYLMQYELGTFGAIVYFLPYIWVIVKTVLDRKKCNYFVPAAVSLAVLTSYVFLPNVQTFEVLFYCFLFFGFHANPDVRAQFVPSDSGTKECYRSWYRRRRKARLAAREKYAQLIQKNGSARILVILHLYYQQSWKEIRQYLDNLGDYPYDLVVTVIRDHADPQVLAQLEAYPHTRKVILCENKGFDLGPFFQALSQTDLDAYDMVFKLQSKSTKRRWIYIYRQWFFRRDWFLDLYDGILSAENAHLTVDALYADPQVGLVAAENLLVQDPPHKQALIREISRQRQLPMPQDYRFVAGTCFAVRAACLKPIQAMGLTADDFQNTLQSRGLSYAHFIERYLCGTVQQQGFSLKGLPTRKKGCLTRMLQRIACRYSAERLFNEDILIDPEYFFWQLDNRFIKYKFVEVPIGSLYYTHDFKKYPFMRCPPYRYLEGDVEGYRQYCDYHQKQGLPCMTPERFDALQASIAQNGYDARHVIIITDGNVIMDGQHRACCLCKQLGKDAKVRMLKIRYVGLKEWIKRMLPKPLLRRLLHMRKG